MDRTTYLQRFLAKVQGAVLNRPRRVIAASILLVLAAAALGRTVEFRTSRSDLSPPDDPDEQRFERIASQFAGTSDVVACVEAEPGLAETPERLHAFADALARSLRSDPEVAEVFYKADLDWFAERALYFVPPGELSSGIDALRDELDSAGGAGLFRGIVSVNDAVAARLEAGLTATSPPPEQEAHEGIGYLSAFLDAERRFLQDPNASLAWLESAPPILRLAGDRPELASGGYLATRDGKTLFLLVSPASEDDSLPALKRLMKGLEARAHEASAAMPGFRIGFTGDPAMTVEEMAVVRKDTWLTAAVAAIGVILLTFLVFRWRSHALLALAALLAGVVWALGAVKLELGYLNLITSSFISTLVGVGVAYAIHPISEYELQGAHTSDPTRAVREAYHATGAAVTTGAVTTAGAFFSILLMQFRGFAELGLVAGVGVLLCLAAALLTLPAILVVHGRWRHARAVRLHAAPAALDRIWGEGVAGRICHYPKLATALAAVVTIALGWAAWGVGFDTSLLDMLPRNAESVRYLKRMIEDSDLSPDFNLTIAEDLGALKRMRDRARKERSIGSFDSVLRFLPDDTEASRAAVEKASRVLGAIELPAKTEPAGKAALAASLGRIEEAIDRSAEAAFGAGLGALAGPLEEARGKAEAAKSFVEQASPEAERAWTVGQDRLLEWARRALADLKRAAAAAPPTPGDLPPEIRTRFVTRSGGYVALLHPSRGIFKQDFLNQFDEASRRVSPDVTGFPIIFRTMSHRITAGFHRSAAVAALVVFLILLADFRSLSRALLALLPLAMGVVWMLGGMRLLGFSFNFANLVAVPLIIGVGIDNGVHVIHRIRLEGERGMIAVLRHTGRAVLIASLTTMIGFGSLALASHRGLASLGTILLLGVGACLVTSMVVLPNILVAFGRVHR